jgi:hypothetical protein
MMMNTVSNQDKTVLPVLPAFLPHTDERDFYFRFMRHLRNVPTSRMEIKILSAIQFTADMLGHSDAHVAKVLVEFGLRAPRMAFPADFLRFADWALMRSGWEVGCPSKALLELKAWWGMNGEESFAAFQGDYETLRLPVTM